jgi:hypothetical protein
MSALRRAVQEHFHKNPYRYRVAHFGLNRAQRRSDARRDPCSSKLMTPPPHNVPYVRAFNEELADA